MSVEKYNTIKSLRVQDIPNLPLDIALDWLSTQPDFIGEAVAKACYQKLAKRWA